jgi:hypothetical protein
MKKQAKKRKHHEHVREVNFVAVPADPHEDVIKDMALAEQKLSAARHLQKAATPHPFLRDRTATAASLRRTHVPKEAGASGTLSVYCSTEKAVYTLTVNAE